MKKILAILLIVFGLWYFYNLGQNQEAIKNAKKDLLNDKQTTEEIEKNNENNIKTEENIDQQEKNKPSYKVENLDENNFIEIDDLTNSIENIVDKIDLTGKVLNKNVDKIIVKFSNNTSDFANDEYELQTFKLGDNSFKYHADSKEFTNLDYGENKYIIEAYIGDKKSVTNLTINIPQDFEPSENSTNTKVTFDKKIIGDLVVSLPQGSDFGNPLSLDEDKITYSNISGLEITKQDLNKDFLSSENIWKKDGTGYIGKNDYWHIFRNIDYNNKDSGVDFFVLRKDGTKVIYEKHYLDFKNNLVGILKIKETDFISYDELDNLNNELKEKKGDFEEVKKTDKLFMEIVR